MKKPLACKLMVDPRDVRRAVALFTGEALTDEELEKQFFDRDPTEIEFPGNPTDVFEMSAAMVALMIANDAEKKEQKTERPKGKFQQKMDEMVREANKNKKNI